VLFLILTFFSAAGLFMLLGAEFLAMLLVIVYVGAVAVLFLFVVMMLDINFEGLRKGVMSYLPVGALGTAIIAYFNGGLTIKTLGDSFTATARSTAMIFFIVLGAAFYNGFLALTQVPQSLSDWVVSQGFTPYFVLAVILLLYLIFGCFMDSLSMILLTVPIFFPVVSVLDFGLVSMEALHAKRALEVLAAGVPEGMTDAMLASIRSAIEAGETLTREQLRALDLRITPFQLEQIQLERTAIWFGILVLIVVEVGLITPPVGMNLFIINAMDRATSMLETYKAVIFYVASDLIRVVILAAFPAITLFLIPW